MKLVLYHNETSGTAETSAEELISAFTSAGHDVIYRSKKGDEPTEDELSQADLVVAAGGDGTFGKAIRKFRNSVPRFAIVPLGTANNVARSVGYRGTPAEIARGLAQAEERPFDIGAAHGPWGRREFVEAVGAGPLAASLIAAHGQDMSSRDKFQFSLEALRSGVAESPPCRWRVLVDGEPLPEELVMLEVLNVPISGPNLRLAQFADPGDGVLTVAFLTPEGRGAMLDALDASDRPLPLEIARGRRVELTWNGEPLRIDDKFPDAEEASCNLTVEIDREPVRLVLPPSAQTKEGHR